MRQTLRVNRYMQLDTANLFARIVAFFHGRIRVLHTLRVNNQEKEAWLSRMLLEYGPCGFNISCGIDDTPALATVLFGDERNLPGVENMPTAPVTNGADVISSQIGRAHV